MYILTIDQKYTQFRLVPDFTERDYYVSRGVSVYQLLNRIQP
jgi:hypothetical protein